MVLIKKETAEEYNGDGYSGMDYPMTDPDINLAIININCRSPKTGYQVNENCKELLYILRGKGSLFNMQEKSCTNFSQGDVILIDKGEYYAFEGNFEAAVSCTPAWTSEQHKYTDEQ